MINHIKLKIALPVLVAALSTTAFAANDMHASLSESGSNNLVASLSPNSSKARPDSSRAAKDDGGSIGIDAKAKNINNSVQDMASQQANSNDTRAGPAKLDSWLSGILASQLMPKGRQQERA